MCTTLFAYKSVPGYDLVLASNRDEFHHRPTLPAHFQAETVLSGIDKEAGGTWLGISRSGKIADLTNHRDFRIPLIDNAPTRGNLVSDFLKGEAKAEEYLQDLAASGEQYNGFSLLAGTLENLYYFSNRQGEIQQVTPGIHGLSNAFLNSPWPKVVRGKKALEQIFQSQGDPVPSIFDLMRSTEPGPDELLPDTGRNLEFERMVSPLFIEHPVYGTRCTSIIFITDKGNVRYYERSFDNQSAIIGEEMFEFTLVPESI